MEEQKRISDGGEKFVILVYGYELRQCRKADFYKIQEEYKKPRNLFRI